MKNEEEQANRVLAKYGYLVFGTEHEHKIGDILAQDTIGFSRFGRFQQPFRVIGVSTLEEYNAHMTFINGPIIVDEEDIWPFFYKVITE